MLVKTPNWYPEFLVEEKKYYGGIQKVYNFPNGYGASVIQHEGSYGFEKGQWELAVLFMEELCYSSPITDDVIGYLNEPQVDNLLEQIKQID
jgi:hypothetical protein|tara:strand:+ start:88 stop:363 length:276 start_codon:yes stop_codon:yes gene_type:complete